MAQPPIRIPTPAADEVEEGTSAIAEAAAVATGLDLSSRRELATLNKLLRRDAVDLHWHRILIGGIYFVGACAAAIFGVLVWNMVAPSYWRFLDPTQQAALQTFLFSGALGSGVTAAAKKIAGKNEQGDDS